MSPSPATEHPGDEPVVVRPNEGSEPGSAVIGAVGPEDALGRRSVEVILEGWRFEFLVEDEDRASLRDRASRDRTSAGETGGRLEIRAIIPGRVVAVAVAVGDAVETGQTLLAVEAMKMQNELQAPRPGSVSRIAGAGQTVEVGDVLVVLE